MDFRQCTWNCEIVCHFTYDNHNSLCKESTKKSRTRDLSKPTSQGLLSQNKEHSALEHSTGHKIPNQRTVAMPRDTWDSASKWYSIFTFIPQTKRIAALAQTPALISGFCLYPSDASICSYDWLLINSYSNFSSIASE